MKRNSDAFSVWSFEITPDMHVLSNGTILEEDEEEEEKVQVSSVASSEVKKANVGKSEEGRSKPVKKVEPKKVRKSRKRAHYTCSRLIYHKRRTLFVTLDKTITVEPVSDKQKNF